ncbi:DUF1206 domain-containing protein [Demequina phytophila]|uniref:DUF1206 domain-containing protein n=1 Tax=Demequina phytophila TaxID=1638981 RepID=UPI0009E3132C|nr:DUF1206 domain-containing protein [Demequina phytophila]
MTSATSSARSGTSGDVWEKAARAGYAVSGVLHLVLGFLIVQIGLGSDAEADQTHALASVGHTPLGAVVLWAAAIAFLALGLWQLADAFRGGAEGKDRAKSGGKAVMYAALAFTATSVAMGSGGKNGDQQAQGFAGTLMEAPAGRALVGAVGLGIIGGAIYHVVKGARKKFLEDLKALPGHRELGAGVVWLGRVGYVAKGIALGVVGILFLSAAFTANAQKAKGIDGAVEWLLGAPGGPVVVVLVGLGFAAYGLYSFARARYARM